MHTATTPPAHGSGSGSGSMPYPPLPASPTLTNPDMILPDYDDTCSSPDRSHSPLIMWKNAHAADMGFDLTPQAFTGPITPTTPIIYGNGTMLSDIGEVTEVESTCPPNKPRSGSIRSDASLMQPASLAQFEALKKKASQISRERRASIDSTSTITTHEQAGVFADFDDAVSVDDSNFQGDDEESVADSFIDDASVHEDRMAIREVRRGVGQEHYSTALSRRAEQILANAKRRLTTMEGNLNRARTPLSPTFSLESGSTPSPPIARPSTAIHRDHDINHRKSAHGHTRVSSENNIPTLPIDVIKPGIFVPRSSSALGAAGGYRPPLHSPRSADYIQENSRSSTGALYAKSKSSPLHAKDHMLEPLSEDDVSQGLDSSRTSLDNAKLDSFLSPSFGSFSDKGLKRSASTAQMRDLKDQMKDLKGRLSTLRDQARADSLKRRSLQSLRTPSPFTHSRVEQWYADAAKYGDAESVHSDSKSQLSNDDVSSIVGGEGIAAGNEIVGRESTPNGVFDAEDSAPVEPIIENGDLSAPDQVEDDLDDMRTQDGSDEGGDEADQENGIEVEAETEMEEVEQDVVDDSASESGASAYFDSVQNQVSHEDREDAFDYEHFFLHSAMGTMSQNRMRKRGSRDSFSSEDSVETTRGPIASTNGRSGRSRSRRASIGSTSSVESFATATEGRTTRTDNEAAEAYRERGVIIPKRARTHTPDTARRAGFANETSDSGSDKVRPRPSDIRRPQSSAAAFMHRPSISSLDSSKTHRSFPLVNKPKVNGGILTPRESPDRELRRISEALFDESLGSVQSGDSKVAPIEMLQKDDRILVERLIANLGRCVLGLAESGRGTTEYRSYRRRIDAARRVLENLEGPA
ncbi:uncharacterized protein F4822DRAFT_431712 [Hypoxylon trugodes]|uniref:uncharacterized protein n=1 Tax=Hypoxylon trugodes TaxID=326681 RepID=UPI0021A210CA|nr:uncharacterized protein F4822DRAFT_431712 [Hypoxylon trugodes]KAI1386844.1 hypothetical protein F4822DRAFT_431712 [Hypoxylon trugodes]